MKYGWPSYFNIKEYTVALRVNTPPCVVIRTKSGTCEMRSFILQGFHSKIFWKWKCIIVAQAFAITSSSQFYYILWCVFFFLVRVHTHLPLTALTQMKNSLSKSLTVTYYCLFLANAAECCLYGNNKLPTSSSSRTGFIYLTITSSILNNESKKIKILPVVWSELDHKWTD